MLGRRKSVKVIVCFVLMVLAGGFAAADEGAPALVCKTVEKVSRTVYVSKVAHLFKDKEKKGRFHPITEYPRDLVFYGLDKDTPQVKSVYHHGKDNIDTYDEKVTVIKRSPEDIVMTYVKGMEAGMITVWLKENKAVLFYSQTASGLSAYVTAYECR